MVKSIIQSIRKRNRLFKRAKRTGDFSHYKLARNRTLAQLRHARKVYFNSLNPKDPKKFWKVVKYLNKNRQAIPTLIKDRVVAYNDSNKGNMLNAFFSSCFNTSHPPIEAPGPSTGICPREILCSESEVGDLLASLDVSKSSGQDSISASSLHTVLPRHSPSTSIFHCNIMPFHLLGRRHLLSQSQRTLA